LTKLKIHVNYNIMSNISTSIEDYLEAIGNLLAKGKRARISDIARIMNVSRPSVTQIVSKMVEMGMVTHKSYGDVKLTPKGEKIAYDISHKHELLKKFLVDILQVDEPTAQVEACKMEHAIGPFTTERFATFINFLENNQSGEKTMKVFKKCLVKKFPAG